MKIFYFCNRCNLNLKTRFEDSLKDPFDRHFTFITESKSGRTEVVIDAIKTNMNDTIIVSDINVVFDRPLMSIIKEYMIDKDIVFQREYPPNDEIKIEFMSILCNAKTLKFWKQVYQIIHTTDLYEQETIQHFLNNENMLKLKWGFFPTTIFKWFNRLLNFTTEEHINFLKTTLTSYSMPQRFEDMHGRRLLFPCETVFDYKDDSELITPDIRSDLTIPPNLFLFWHNEKLPLSMSKNVEKLKHHFEDETNKVWLYNEESARKEIEETITKCNSNDPERYFYKAILVVYDALFAKAFKCDLFRYFILYEKGGIYLDIKFYPVNGFDLTRFVGIKKELYVQDEPPRCVYNAFMICKQKSYFMRKALKKLLKNAFEGFKGPNALCPTGPLMLGEILKTTAFTEVYMPYLKLQQEIYDRSGKRLIETYPEYRKEQDNSGIRDETDYTYAWTKGTHINAFALEPLHEIIKENPSIFWD